MRDLADAGGTGAADAVPPDKHFRATAAPAKAAVWGVLVAKKAAEVGGSDAGLVRRTGMGIPAVAVAAGKASVAAREERAKRFSTTRQSRKGLSAKGVTRQITAMNLWHERIAAGGGCDGRETGTGV